MLSPSFVPGCDLRMTGQLNEGRLPKCEMSTNWTPVSWRRGHGKLTGNLWAMPARTMPVDIVPENVMTCGGW